jgi:hypothetical protein
MPLPLLILRLHIIDTLLPCHYATPLLIFIDAAISTLLRHYYFIIAAIIDAAD